MKKLFFIISIVIMASCARNRDPFSRVKIGMKSSEVVKLLGAPARKQPMGVSMWWLYNDPEKHMVIINGDTVANYTTQKDAMRIMDDALRTYDSIHRKKNL